MMGADEHGSDSTYTNHRCRCAACRSAHALVVRNQRRRRSEALQDGRVTVSHGLASTYQNWGCRCQECTAAAMAYWNDWYRKRKAGTL